MEIGIGDPRRGIVALLAIVAALALTFCVHTGVAAAGDGPQAQAAKKKKKCSRKNTARCVVRAALKWDDNAYIELHAWDSQLRHESPYGGNIPKAFVKEVNFYGYQKFFTKKRPRGREFAFGVCLRKVPQYDPTNYTLRFRRGAFGNGERIFDQDSLYDEGQSISYVWPGARDPDPNLTGYWCPNT